MRKVFVFAVALSLMLLAAVPAFADGHTIADIVINSTEGDMPEFTVLLTAVSAADPLVLEALSDEEAELTVFAPTDAAFGELIEALGEEAFGELVADTETLTEILLYHVVGGAVMSGDVVEGLGMNDGAFSVATLQGQYIDIAGSVEDGITIDGANLNLEMIDIEADNGVIHVIDAVIVPEARTIAEIVVDFAGEGEMMDDMDMEEMEPEFTLLLAAVGAADPAVLEALSDEEAELTVFAPTDAAFTALGEETLNAVLADTELLTTILLYHVVGSVVYSDDVAELLMDADMGVDVEMLAGPTANISADEDGIYINDAQIVLTDVDAVNGVIHVIDAVILPPEE